MITEVPGSSDFVLVPTSVLSTEADVVRVTAPGSKFCEGATDTPGDGLRLETVNPNYDLTNLRPPGFEPHVSGMVPGSRPVPSQASHASARGICSFVSRPSAASDLSNSKFESASPAGRWSSAI